MLLAVLPLGVFASAEGATGERLGVGEGASALDGKKILFTGCSYTYYGGIVEQTGSTNYTQSARTSGETGFFKRLCSKNGVKNLTVTDWVFGGHDLTDIFDGYCNAGDHDGHDHLADLVDRDYDIVILQDILTPGYTTGAEYVDNLRNAMAPFTAVNPNTKFYLMLHNQTYLQNNYAPLRASVQLAIEELGIEVIDWGALVYDVINGNVAVPGATMSFNKQSFIVSNSASDGYHPNLLSGYIGTLMVYATLTGETIIGQPYEWIYPLTSKYLNIDKYITSHYKYDNPSTTDVDESKTNMKEVFYSAQDMLGFQMLAEEYLTKTRWLDFAEYTVEFLDESGESLSSAKYKWGDEIEAPTAPIKSGDSTYEYVFAGWDKDVSPCKGDATYKATYERVAIDYTVRFLDEDGSVLSEAVYHYGDTVAVPNVSDHEDDSYRYIFAGWDKTVTACTGDAVYTAKYTKMAKGFVVSFRDYDGTLISAVTYSVGDAVTAPDAPVRAADNTYTYAFAGWDKPVTACDGDATYTATYTAAYVEYTVTFRDHDGSVISEGVYHYGDAVTAPNAPARDANEVYRYEFAGWDKTVVSCDGDAVYTATYNEVYVLYVVLFLDEYGEVIQNMTRRWGQSVTAPEGPPKVADGEYTYTFAGWDKPVDTECRGNATYTAVYEATPIPEEEPEISDDTAAAPGIIIIESPDAPLDEDVEEDGGFLAAIKAFFERIAEWLASLFGGSRE